MRTLLSATLLLGISVLGAEVATVKPQFTDGNHLIRPEGYRQWVFVGSGLGMSYDEGPYEKSPNFTNIYILPEAYRQFSAGGTFPDGTMLVMEIVSAGSQASINKRGRFQDRFIGIEAAVKDEKRFPEKWAYFSFIGPDREALTQAKSFPKKACWKCHQQHAAVDNVFVQFYPVLRAAHKNASYQ